MATRASSGGSRTLTKKPRTKRKRQCELGTACPYKGEYQHKLEFDHDGNGNVNSRSNNSNGNRNNANSSGGAMGDRQKTTLNGTGALKGTGSRGRKLAVAADRKRAERTLRNDGEHALSDNAGDVRDAQRARRVMQLQKQIQETAQQQRSASTEGPGCGSFGGGARGGDGGGGGGTAAAGSRGFHGTAAGTLQEGGHRKARKVESNSRDGTRQDQEREVVEVDTDDEDAPITSATSQNPFRSRATAAAANRSSVNDSPATRSSTPAPVEPVQYWEDEAQRQGERAEDGWDCNVCTFRNGKMSNVLDLACAVCDSERCP